MQLALLLVLTAAHLIFLRLLIPMRLRLDQICEVTSAAVDVATVVCAFLLLSERSAGYRSVYTTH